MRAPPDRRGLLESGLVTSMDEQTLRVLETAYRQQQSGQLAEAEAQYRNVLRRHPTNVHALNLLGAICVNSGRAQEGAPLIEAALRQSDDDQAYANLGLAYQQLDRFEEARVALAQAITRNPANPIVHNNLGNVLLALERPQEAIGAFRQALSLHADYAECLSNLAGALAQVDQLVPALAAADRAIALGPNAAQAHNNRGEVLFRQARFDEAVVSYRRAVDLDDQYHAAKINLSAGLKETGDVEGARELLLQVIKDDPDNPRAYNNLGVLLEQLGQGEAAAAAFREAIARSPNYANAYYQLAQLRGQGLSDAEVDQVRTLLADPSLGDKQVMPLSFALACACNTRKDYARTFKHLSRAQALKADENPYDDGRIATYYARVMEVFATPLGPLEPSTLAPQPVFVLGMPRSGTSLVEQVLSSHPAVCGAGELSFMEDLVAEAKRSTGHPYPECCQHLSGGQRDELGQMYLQRLAQRGEGASMVIDKTPMNFQYIGLISAVLPQARFVHCTRHPVANCWSIFRLPFEKSHAYAHSLDALGRYYRRYRELMQHWAHYAGERMIELPYEAMIDDLPAQSERLLAFVGLPFDPRVLKFHQTDRIVKTPSASQVRAPIYRSSLESWKHYAPFLGPLLAHLGDDEHD